MMIFNILESDIYFLVYSKGIYFEISKHTESIYIKKRKVVGSYYQSVKSQEDLKKILFAVERILKVYTKDSKIIPSLFEKETYYNINPSFNVRAKDIVGLCKTILNYYKDIEREHFKFIDESDNFIDEVKKYIGDRCGSLYVFNDFHLELKKNKEILKEFVKYNSKYYDDDKITGFLKYCDDYYKAEVLQQAKKLHLEVVNDELLLDLLSSKDFKIIKK